MLLFLVSSNLKLAIVASWISLHHQTPYLLMDLLKIQYLIHSFLNHSLRVLDGISIESKKRIMSNRIF